MFDDAERDISGKGVVGQRRLMMSPRSMTREGSAGGCLDDLIVPVDADYVVPVE